MHVHAEQTDPSTPYFRPHLLRRSAGLLVQLVRSWADAAFRDALDLRLCLRSKLVGRGSQLAVRELRAGDAF